MYKGVISLEDEQKIIINDKANILLKNLIIPLVNAKERDKEINNLMEYLCNFLTLSGSLSKIFELKNALITGIFTIETVQLFCDVIYTIMSYHDNLIITNKKNFKELFSIAKEIKLNKNDTQFFINNNRGIIDDDDEKKNYKEIKGYYYFDLIFKIFKLHNEYVTCVNGYNPISNLISKLKKKNNKDIRKIICEIIL
jgi:hypothetical protein